MAFAILQPTPSDQMGLLKKAASCVLNLRAHRLGALAQFAARKAQRTHVYASLLAASPAKEWVLAHLGRWGEKAAF
ncbi:MAG: hypothetical protein O7F12_05050 [Nitrospirae bacterium]|nr:hypothetical protein [Nitrospirota bacterium]